MNDAPELKPDDTPPPQIQYSYIKSNLFRVIHVDGAVAGAGPAGIFLSIYSERVPIPQQQVFGIDVAKNKIGAEIVDQRVVKSGVVREVEAGLAMTLQTAEALAALLQRHVKAIKAQIEAAKAKA